MSEKTPPEEPATADDPKKFQKCLGHYNTTMVSIFNAANTPKADGMRAIMTGIFVGLRNFVAQNISHELDTETLATMDSAERAAYTSWLRIEQTLDEDRGHIKAILVEHRDPRAKLF